MHRSIRQDLDRNHCHVKPEEQTKWLETYDSAVCILDTQSLAPSDS